MGNCLMKMASACGPFCKCCFPCVFDCYSCFVAPFEDENAEQRADGKIQGSLLVQLVRDVKQFPARPSVYLTGPKVPLELKPLGDPSEKNDEVVLGPNEELTTFLLMLPSNYISMGQNYEIIARFPTNAEQDPKGEAVVKRISVHDAHIVRTTIDKTTERKSLVQWWPIKEFSASDLAIAARPAQVAAHPGITGNDVNLDNVRAAISRFSMIPNHRYPYVKEVIQEFNWTNRNVGVLNPYPDAINHTSEGDMWVNWAGTQASKPVRIYSDGALWAKQAIALLWAAEAKHRKKLKASEVALLEAEHTRRVAVLESVAHPSPRTVEGLQLVVRYAKENGLRVRVFGCNHSFAPICGTSEVLVDGRCINSLPRVTGPGSDDTPKVTTERCSGRSEVSPYVLWERYHLSLNPSDPLAAGFESPATATFSPGISTGDFERWIETVCNNGAPNGYKMPTSTVEDVFTMGGVLSVGCHGTGMSFPTCSDWVVSMRFVDSDGDDVTIARNAVPEKYKAKLRNLLGSKLPPAEQTDASLNEDFWKAMQCNMGAFGIIYSYTMVVFPIVKSWLLMQHLPWRDYFDDTDEARKNLYELQQGHDSCEFFYFPFMLPDDLCGKKVTMIDSVYTWLTNHGDEVPHVKNMRMKSGAAPYTGPCIPFKTTEEQWYGIDLQYHVGAVLIAAGLKKAMTNADSAKSLPDIAALFSVYVPAGGWQRTGVLCCGTEAPVVYEVPHWRSNHPIDAIGAVESIKVVNVEYAIPINFGSPAGMAPANQAFGDCIRAINAAWDSKVLDEAASGDAGCCGCVGNCFSCCCSPPADKDMSHFPVTVNCEMRLLQGSGALLCAEYTDDKFVAGDSKHEWKVKGSDKLYNGWALPELVSHSGNQGWNNFFTQMTHHMIEKFQVKGESMVRFHMAKEFSALPGMLEHVRDTFRNKATYKSSDPWTRWLAIRQVIDPTETFLNPYLKQLFSDDAETYQPPNNLPIRPQGLIDDCDDTLTVLAQLHPHRKESDPDVGPNVVLIESDVGQVAFHHDEDDYKQ